MILKLLCCSDTHGIAPPALNEAGALAWLHAGDAYGEQVESIEDPKELWRGARTLPVFGVYGNHDVDDRDGWFRAIEAIDGRVVRIADDLVVAGIGWHGERHYECPLERDLERVCNDVTRQMLRLTRSTDRVVLLTHYPPRIEGLFPAKPGATVTPGYDVIVQLVQEIKPLLIVQGHEHYWFGESATIEFGSERRCWIINPGPRGMIVDVDVANGTVAIR